MGRQGNNTEAKMVNPREGVIKLNLFALFICLFQATTLQFYDSSINNLLFTVKMCFGSHDIGVQTKRNMGMEITSLYIIFVQTFTFKAQHKQKFLRTP